MNIHFPSPCLNYDTVASFEQRIEGIVKEQQHRLRKVEIDLARELLENLKSKALSIGSPRSSATKSMRFSETASRVSETLGDISLVPPLSMDFPPMPPHLPTSSFITEDKLPLARPDSYSSGKKTVEQQNYQQKSYLMESAELQAMAAQQPTPTQDYQSRQSGGPDEDSVNRSRQSQSFQKQQGNKQRQAFTKSKNKGSSGHKRENTVDVSGKSLGKQKEVTLNKLRSSDMTPIAKRQQNKK